jgi:hypothetical protein
MEKKMTLPPWQIDEVKDEINIIGADSYGEAICTLYSDPMDEDTRANAKAIVTAINFTYGKGIDPSSVPELLEALKAICNSYYAKNLPPKLVEAAEMAIHKSIIKP